MAEVELPGGIKFKGGKIFVILTALTTAGGALWGGFEFYKDYLTMKEQIQEYVAPDLSGFDKDIAVMKEEMDSKTDLIQTEVEMLMSEMEMMMQEIRLVADVANELKNDLRQDVRRVEKIGNDVEQQVKIDSRENSADLKHTSSEIEANMEELKDDLEAAMIVLQEKIDKQIKSALSNPLSQMK